MKKVKMLVSVVAAVMLLMLVLVSVAYGQGPGGDEGDVTGSFQIASITPTVGTIAVSPDPMTPMEQWTEITVPITDLNTLVDVDEVHVEVFYDSGGDPAAPGVANVQTAAILTWDRTGDSWSIAPGGTTWAINAAGCSRPNDSLSTGNWVFSFRVGKVATESDATNKWDVYARATDLAANAGDNYLRDVDMNWYGEITANTALADWGSVDPGTGFGDNVNEINNVSINYIANGAYDEGIKSSSTWSGATYNADLDVTGATASANEFSLTANDLDDFTNRVLVVTTTAGVDIDDTGTQTAEAGDTVAGNSLWLRLASVFAGDTYTGTITYIIANGN